MLAASDFARGRSALARVPLLTLVSLATILAAPAAAWQQSFDWIRRDGGTRSETAKAIAVVPDGSGDFVMGGIYADTRVGSTCTLGDYPNEVTLPGLTDVVAGFQECFVAYFEAGSSPDEQPQLRWAATGGGTYTWDEVNALAVDPEGSVYATGSFGGREPVYGSQQATFYSAATSGGPSYGPYTTNTMGTSAVWKYNSSGELQWFKYFDSIWNNEGTSITILANGYVVAAGMFRSSIDIDGHVLKTGSSYGYLSPDVWVAVMEPEHGDVVDVFRIHSTSSEGVYSCSTVLNGVGDLTNSFVLSGSWHGPELELPGHDPVTGTAWSLKMFVARFDPDVAAGPTDWTASWVRTAEAQNLRAWAAVSPNRVFVTGHFARSATFDTGITLGPDTSVRKMFLALYDPGTGDPIELDGAPIAKYTEIGGSNSIFGISARLDDKCVVIGDVRSATFGLGEPNQTSLNGRETKVLWYDSQGFFQGGATGWRADSYVATSFFARSLATLPDGSCIVGGRWTGRNGLFRGRVGSEPYLESDPISHLGNQDEDDIFLVKIRLGLPPAPSLLVEDLVQECDDPTTSTASVYITTGLEGEVPPGSTLAWWDVTDPAAPALLHEQVLLGVETEAGFGPTPFPMSPPASIVRAILSGPGGTELATADFQVTVQDTTPPDLSCHPHLAECQGAETDLSVSWFLDSVWDNCDLDPQVDVEPKRVGAGVTLVTLRAIDATGNASACQTTVDVRDTLAPQFVEAPSDGASGEPAIRAEATGGVGGAWLTFPLAVEDLCDELLTVTCQDATGATVDPVGQFYPCGLHAVTCTAVDASGNVAVHQFTIEVYDETAPVILCPDDLVVGNDPGVCHAAVAFVVTATDNCDPSLPVVCTVEGVEVFSGDAFWQGSHVVECTATDKSGNIATCSFNVTVLDLEPPVVTCPAFVEVVTDCSGSPRNITWDDLEVAVTDNCDTAPVVTYEPSVLEPGVTTVYVTAVDAAGNPGYASTQVTVLKGPFESRLGRPLDANVDNRIHVGQVVPIKVKANCENVFQSDVTAMIDQVLELASDGTPVENMVVDDAGLSADDGSIMHLSGDQFVYNLRTTGWTSTPGTRFEVVLRFVRPEHVDTLFSVFLVAK